MPHLLGGSDMKKILFNNKLAILLAAILIAMSGCEKKVLCYLDHPHNPLNVHATFTINFNSAWDNSDTPYLNTASNYNVRYTLEFYTMDSEGNKDSLVSRQQFVGSGLVEGNNTQTVKIDLPSYKMKMICWADLVKKGETTNTYFDVSNLSQVQILTSGFDANKDAFTNAQDIDYTTYVDQPEGVDVTGSMTLLRPFGCYKLVANDYQKYKTEKGAAATEPSFTNVAYQLWIPAQYNGFTQKPQDAVTSISYKYNSGPGSGIYCPLASDIIFIGTADTEYQYYNLIAAVYDTSNKLMATSANVEAKILRNKITYIYGPFLTTSNIGSSGIDDSFDHFIDIVIPD
jgi:hypothetical protein